MRLKQKRLTGNLLGLVFITLLVTGAAIYGNTLSGPFVFDDFRNIVENPYIRITEISPEQIVQIQNSPSPRPLANLTLALNYYFHRYQPAGYHLINILIHIITAMLVFLIVMQTLHLCRIESAFWPSLAAPLVWLTHPIHTQSVTYIVQRMNSLAAMFYLLALFCYGKARIIPPDDASALIKRGLMFTIVIIAGLLGLGAKPITATLPFALLLYEWYFLNNLNSDWPQKQAKWIIGAIAVLLILVFIYFGDNPIEKILGGYERRDFSLSERILTQPRIIIFYISLLLFPHPSRLNLVHDFSVSHSLLAPATTSLAILALVVLFVAAVVAAQKKHRLISFAIIWFLGNLILESSVLALELIFEHRTYLPSVFPVIAITVIAIRPSPWRRVTIPALIIIIGLASFWTYQRNTIWKNEARLWKDCADKSPRSDRAHNNLGLAYKNKNNYDKALAHYEKALAIRTALRGEGHLLTAEVHNNIAMVCRLKKIFEKALHHLHKALNIKLTILGPKDIKISESYNSLGIVYRLKKDFSKSRNYLHKALDMRLAALEPEAVKIAESYNNLGILYSDMKRYDQAVKYFQQSLIRYTDPLDIADVYDNLGLMYKTGDNDTQALACHKKALDIRHSLLDAGHPSIAESYNNIGTIYASRNDYKQAIHYFHKALPDPSDTIRRLHSLNIYHNLGSVYYAIGDYQSAGRYYRTALDIQTEISGDRNPKLIPAYIQLGVNCYKIGEIGPAVRYYQKALSIAEQTPDVDRQKIANIYNNLGIAYYAQQEDMKAMSSFRKSLAIYEKALGHDHSMTRQAQKNIDRIATRNPLNNHHGL